MLDDDKEHVLADFTEVGQRVVLLKGGDGGRGNASYKTSTNRAPRQHGTGWPGEEMWVWLRLKLIADAGLVGLPNAGKSTFLNAVSNAKAKVGDYPFTTLHPKLGVVRHKGVDFVLADIPGLIEGAAEGAGIGDRFLGHVERTRVLLHLVDANNEDVAEAYRTVRDELDAYGAGLDDKPEVIALNKADTIDDELAEALAGGAGARHPAPASSPSPARPARASTRCSTPSSSASASSRQRRPETEAGWSPLVSAAPRPRRHRRHRLRRRHLLRGRPRGRPTSSAPSPAAGGRAEEGIDWVEGALDRPESLADALRGRRRGRPHRRPDQRASRAGFEAVNVGGTAAMIDAARAGRRPPLRPHLLARRARAGAFRLRLVEGEVGARSSPPRGLDWTIIRPPAVYGPGDRETFELFKMARRGLVALPPGGRFSVIHVEDLCPPDPRRARRARRRSAETYEPDDGTRERLGATAISPARSAGSSASAPPPLAMPKAVVKGAARVDRLVRRDKAKLTPDRVRYFCHPDWVVTAAGPPAGDALDARSVRTPTGLKADRRMVSGAGLAAS